MRSTATGGATTPQHNIWFGRDDPNSPDATYQYSRRTEDLIQDSEEGGRNIRLHRNGVVALTYALWEDEYRERIALECGLPRKDDIESVVFQDLNKYRQAVLHASGKLDRVPQAIRLFKKDDVVSFTKDLMHDLFSALIDELNRLGDKYYGQNPGLSLDKSMRRS